MSVFWLLEVNSFCPVSSFLYISHYSFVSTVPLLLNVFSSTTFSFFLFRASFTFFPRPLCPQFSSTPPVTIFFNLTVVATAYGVVSQLDLPDNSSSSIDIRKKNLATSVAALHIFLETFCRADHQIS